MTGCLNRQYIGWVALLLSLTCVSTTDPASSSSSSSSPEGASTAFIPFDVTFSSNAPLGLRLDADLNVVGFSGSNGPAEASGWIQAGDALTAVGGHPVTGRGLAYAVGRIRDTPVPKVLSFVPRRPGEDRAAVVDAREAQNRLSSEAGGTLELGVVTGLTPKDAVPEDWPKATYESRHKGHRVLVYRLPFVKGLFGGMPDCSPRRITVVQPESGCTSFDNEGDVGGAVAVVMRGGCAFSDKAVNIQVADGAAMVVVNNLGPAVPMPLSETERTLLSLPSVMVGEESGKTLLAALAAVDSDTNVRASVRMQLHDTVCPKTWFPPLSVEDMEAEAEAEAAAAASSSGYSRDWSDDSVDPDAAGVLVLKPLGGDGDGDDGGDDDGSDAASLGITADGEASAGGGGASPPSPPPSLARLEFVRAEFGASLEAALVGAAGDDEEATPLDDQVLSRPIVYAEPLMACQPLRNPPDSVAGAVVVVERGGCTFEAKYRNVAAAGGAVLMVINTELGLFAMPTDDNPHESSSSSSSSSSSTAAVMVPREAAATIRRLVQGRTMPVLASVSRRPLLRKFWEELVDLLRHDEWPATFKDRRKMYFQKSIMHHPDRPGGNQLRFEALSFAYRRANYRYDPDSHNEFVDDFA